MVSDVDLIPVDDEEAKFLERPSARIWSADLMGRKAIFLAQPEIQESIRKRVEHQALQERVEKALASLPPDYRLGFGGHSCNQEPVYGFDKPGMDIYGQSVGEIARARDVAGGRMHRATCRNLEF